MPEAPNLSYDVWALRVTMDAVLSEIATARGELSTGDREQLHSVSQDLNQLLQVNHADAR